ncbi:hypothetical protein AVEN_135014-1 [Araneus ventricosus]|uniref:Uncharacterized protein n=1 Tax=Araneus ventricosus TaxID=182803 RepID=A0A4Y2G475_ARAVE|nr:hypothetical protein AVEN_135014-1 [Araneus ventricosus]
MLGKPCQCLNGVLESVFFRSSDRLFDVKKTVEEIVRDQLIDVAFRFILACEFNLLACIRTLWDQLPDIIKLRLRQEDRMALIAPRGLFPYYLLPQTSLSILHDLTGKRS